MKAITHHVETVNQAHALVVNVRPHHADPDVAYVALFVTADGHERNVAVVNMSPDEARKLACQLISYAEKLDPSNV